MTTLKWTPSILYEINKIQKINQDMKIIASDSAAANIFLLRIKHNIKIAWINNLLVREYTPIGDLTYINGVTFPLGNESDEVIKRTLDVIIQDRINRGLKVKFCFLNEEQKKILSNYRSDIKFECYRGLSDYLYSAERLAYLRGRLNHKKKNRFLKFSKCYPNYEVFFFEEYSTEEMFMIARNWLNNQIQPDKTKLLELDSIEEAIQNWNDLRLVGIVIKVNSIPVAMSIASQVSKGVYDIHFEKSYGEYAANGAYAAVNMLFAKWLFETKQAIWLNREEDLDDIGLREAKISYHPDLILNKYTGSID